MGLVGARDSFWQSNWTDDVSAKTAMDGRVSSVRVGGHWRSGEFGLKALAGRKPNAKEAGFVEGGVDVVAMKSLGFVVFFILFCVFFGGGGATQRA